jgi:hypothetical protein
MKTIRASMTTVKAISPMDMVYSPVRVKVYQQLTEPDMIAADRCGYPESVA